MVLNNFPGSCQSDCRALKFVAMMPALKWRTRGGKAEYECCCNPDRIAVGF